MTTLFNQIAVAAPIEKIWVALTNISLLENYDPTVKRSVILTENNSGLGAKRKVEMQDGKNWFEEICVIYEPYKAVAYELTACSFPIHQLKHTYSFEITGKNIIVKQIMIYQVKFGLLGRLLDQLMIRKQSDMGIKLFLEGLKKYFEKG
jgi:ribosome-associated toxin RatA of RatAB toxin-antitoxin module